MYLVFAQWIDYLCSFSVIPHIVDIKFQFIVMTLYTCLLRWMALTACYRMETTLWWKPVSYWQSWTLRRMRKTPTTPRIFLYMPAGKGPHWCDWCQDCLLSGQWPLLMVLFHSQNIYLFIFIEWSVCLQFWWVVVIWHQYIQPLSLYSIKKVCCWALSMCSFSWS